MGAVNRPAAMLALVLLSACHRAPPPVQRITLDTAGQGPETPLASPDTKGAVWTQGADGQRIDFGQPAQTPYLTLQCRAGTPPAVRIIRYVASRPGEQALFPVLGAGPNARFKLNAAKVGGAWAWVGDVPVSDRQLDVFHSERLEATLPGGGSLIIPASPLPGEFVRKCRGNTPVARVTAYDAGATPGSSEPAE